MPQLEQEPSTVPLRLYIDLAEYGVGEFEDSQSVIARPYRRLVEDGVDPGNITYVLIRSTPSNQYKVLGTLCETSGQRLLFFPGGRIRRLYSLFKRKPTGAPQAVDGIVDHITFETSNRKSHVTEVLPDGKRRVVVNLPRRREVGQALYAWFGITLRSVAVLDRVPEKLWFSAECPTSDVDRRLALFRNAGKASRICTLPVAQTTPETFLQINFFVDFAPGQSVPACSFLPNGPPELRKTIEIPSTVTAQLHGLALHDGIGRIKMHPIIWAGEPAHEVVLGF
ncbi:MAG: hypothetical protein ACREOB_12440 [Thermodesulfobacteriota bacterium]